MRAYTAPPEMEPAIDTDGARRDADLFVRRESPLPQQLQAGTANAIFCVGSCFHPRSDVRSLSIRTPTASTEVRNAGLPKLGLYRDVHSRQPMPDPENRAYGSGFWSVVPVGPLDPGTMEVSIVAELEDGSRISEPFAEIPIVARGETARRSARIGICMATYDPDPELFEVQIESIRAQTSDQWVCYVSDDHSPEGAWAEIRRIVGDDERFILSRADERLGFFRNFERALAMAPAGCELIALCDQDDRWYPEKLEALAAAIGEHQLVYSDQRLTLRDGTVIRDTLWVGRSRNEDSLYSMAIANTIVGASTMMRRDLLDRILPFPRTPGWQFHDHWISAVALAAGSIGYIDRPLYDYVQHEGAIVGQASVEEDDEARGPGLLSSLRHPRRMLARWEAIYFRSYIHVALQAEVLMARCGDRLSRRDSRALHHLAGADTSLAGALGLALRPVRELWGRNETLGTEWHLLKGIVWLWIVKLRELGRRSPTGAGQDVSIPAIDIVDFAQWRIKRWVRGRSQAPESSPG